MDIITKRPEGMSFTDYKTHRQVQNAWLKNKLRGEIIVLGNYRTYNTPEGKEMNHRFKGKPFVGKVKELTKVYTDTIKLN